MNMSPTPPLPPDAGDISRIIEMAWEDRTPFESIAVQFGLNEPAVIALMRRQLKRSSFKMWRERVTGRATKHAALRRPEVTRHRASHTRQA
ncbi:MAG: TIGR03643 family protein [Polaromonas sp.]|nr:TIGR03643 family protein [Polaromonas sp.]